MRPTTLATTGQTQIKVLSKSKSGEEAGQLANQAANEQQQDDSKSPVAACSGLAQSKSSPFDVSVFRLKPERLAKRFKLIDEKEWNITSSEPPSETEYFTEGHSAMSIVSVIGSMGAGKSSLLNKLAGRNVFPTHNPDSDNPKLDTRHTTRGIDIYSTYHRILLDCQPMHAPSLLEDFVSGRSSSQFPKNTLISDPLTSSEMISLQLATFLVATSDYVIILLRTLVDVHLLKLLASAIMLIGEDNLRAKFVIFSKDEQVHEVKFKALIDKCLGANVVRNYLSDEEELYGTVAPYSMKKCDIYSEDPSTFTGKNWLSSCQRLWNSTIKGSSMFADYAMHVYNSTSSMIT